MKTVVDKETGKVLYCRYDEVTEPNEIGIDFLLTEEMENPYWDFENEIFYNKIE